MSTIDRPDPAGPVPLGADAADLREIEMTALSDEGLALAGTLALPPGPGPHPGVVLLFGSGRLDRESNAGRLRPNLGRPLAAALARHGIASLRYDRRGVGASQGDWLATGFLDNRADAAACLRALAAHEEIRADAIGAVGHSEGARHALWLGAHAGAKAVVAIAGPTRSGEDAVVWQAGMLARDLPRPVRPLLPLLRRAARRQFERIKSSTSDAIRVAGVRVNARWYQEFLADDPRACLAAVHVPTLAVGGEKDIQVDPADLEEFSRLVQGEVQTWRVPDLTHLLRRDTGPASVRSYSRLLRQPVDADLLNDIAVWLAARL